LELKAATAAIDEITKELLSNGDVEELSEIVKMINGKLFVYKRCLAYTLKYYSKEYNITLPEEIQAMVDEVSVESENRIKQMTKNILKPLYKEQ
jgi:hypothetical protein